NGTAPWPASATPPCWPSCRPPSRRLAHGSGHGSRRCCDKRRARPARERRSNAGGAGDALPNLFAQSLQLALHVAGCPDVVASLGQVNDAATAVLMAKFYHELWVKGRPPLKALRQAQLLVYPRPDLGAGLD